MKVTLYKKDVAGKPRVWQIEQSDIHEIKITHGTVGGEMQIKEIHVPHGKAGRNTNEQIRLEMASRIVRRRDGGYVDSMEEAADGTQRNALNMPKPMLAHKYKTHPIKPPYYIQAKYDGNRCLVAKKNHEVFAYSRNGKIIGSIDHILKAAELIPDGTVLDGELYHHGTKLQTIRSWISRDQEDSKKLVFVCYDVISLSPFSKRLDRLMSLKLKPPIVNAPIELIKEPFSQQDLADKTRDAIQEGFEGLVLRCPKTGYEVGKRSKGLIKVKRWMDDEFLVVDIEQSADGWAILVCSTEEQKTFSVSAPGSMKRKHDIWDDRTSYIGRRVTVEYANLTNQRIPFHPVAIAFRSSND